MRISVPVVSLGAGRGSPAAGGVDPGQVGQAAQVQVHVEQLEVFRGELRAENLREGEGETQRDQQLGVQRGGRLYSHRETCT